ncbi:hypothetical protein CTI12_AA208570 [Artemisia annua]|uniref:Stress-response A/B barrel domain-containing protein n=1 Tax=Artemisia annua TaxID=35608 RepID=A0A2U1P065_ARTAN|nr:hypothetical protein CTI12_AA208570 [Artemisia annua]
MFGQDQIIEHVVFYKVKPDFDSSKVAAMVNGLQQPDVTQPHHTRLRWKTIPVMVIVTHLHSHASHSVTEQWMISGSTEFIMTMYA